MVDLIESNRDALIALCKRHHVKRLDVFGSAATGEGFDPQRSDVDLLVEFDPHLPVSRFANYFDMKEECEVLLKRSVDLVEPGGVTNRYVRGGIERSRSRLYAA